MKKIYYLSFIMMLASVMVYGQAELVAHYMLDETSGTDVADASGNGFDGTVNCDTCWVEGTTDGGFQFWGTENITFPADAMGLTSDEGSISFWMNTEGEPTGINTLFSAGDNLTGGGFGAENEMHVHMESPATDIWTGGELSFFIYADPNNTFLHSDPEKGKPAGVVPVNPTLMNDGVWHHVAATWGDGFVKLYIDGVDFWGDTNAYISTSYELNNMFMGQMLGAGRTYIGKMDDVRLFDAALDADEVDDLFNKIEPPSAVDQLLANEINLAVYPNPATSNASVRFSMEAGRNVSVNVFSVTGALVENVYEGISVSGKNVVQLGTSNYTAGIYFVEVNLDSEVAYTKLIVQ